MDSPRADARERRAKLFRRARCHARFRFGRAFLGRALCRQRRARNAHEQPAEQEDASSYNSIFHSLVHILSLPVKGHQWEWLSAKPMRSELTKQKCAC